MSEDIRKVLQDSAVPELRAIKMRLDALEKSQSEMRSEKRHDEVMAGIRQVVDYESILQRLSRLEALQEAKSRNGDNA